jgi:hypothetical protein
MIDRISQYTPMYRGENGYWFSLYRYEEYTIQNLIEEFRQIYSSANFGYYKTSDGHSYAIRVRFDNEADEAEFIIKESP